MTRLLAAFHAWRINRRQADIRLIAFMERLGADVRAEKASLTADIHDTATRVEK